MKTRAYNTVGSYEHEPASRTGPRPALRPSSLYLISAHELRELREALSRGQLPADFEAKLSRLAEGDLLHRFLARNCRLFTLLLLAAQEGAFKEANPAQCDRLLRVLAYVRKNDDAVPDYRVGGFVDDQQEVRAALDEFQDLLKAFKLWRLRHQVPELWLSN
jgi:hypothetical protein